MSSSLHHSAYAAKSKIDRYKKSIYVKVASLSMFAKMRIHFATKEYHKNNQVFKHLGNPLGFPGNPLLSTGRSDPLIS